MRWFLQDCLFWGLTVIPWLNIYLVARLAWRGRLLLAVLLVPLVGIGSWLIVDVMHLVFGITFFSPAWAVSGWMIQTLWAMGIAICVMAYVTYVRHKEKHDG